MSAVCELCSRETPLPVLDEEEEHLRCRWAKEEEENRNSVKEQGMNAKQAAGEKTETDHHPKEHKQEIAAKEETGGEKKLETIREDTNKSDKTEGQSEKEQNKAIGIVACFYYYYRCFLLFISSLVLLFIVDRSYQGNQPIVRDVFFSR